MFTGRIRGLEMARALGRDVGEVPPEWHRTAEVLKSRPGATIAEDLPPAGTGAYPLFHCSQEIPCNPCTSVCPHQAIRIEDGDIMGLPEFVGGQCDACEKCVAICPGLAVTLVDFRKDAEYPAVTVPYEFTSTSIAKGDVVTVLDTEGEILGNVEVTRVREAKANDRCLMVKVKAPREIASRIAGIRVQEPWVSEPSEVLVPRVDDEVIVCRCERVTAGEIRALIRTGVRDLNELKAITRAGMGACGGKTCPSLIKRLYREEGVPDGQVTELTRRPVFMEVPLGAFAGMAVDGGPPPEAPIRHATGAHEGGL
jgi:sarcosine oxidase subunit alpha